MIGGEPVIITDPSPFGWRADRGTPLPPAKPPTKAQQARLDRIEAAPAWRTSTGPQVVAIVPPDMTLRYDDRAAARRERRAARKAARRA